MEKPNYASLFKWSLGMTTLIVATFGTGLRQKPPHDLTVVLTVIIGGFCAGIIVGGIVYLIQWIKYKNRHDEPIQVASDSTTEEPDLRVQVDLRHNLQVDNHFYRVFLCYNA